MMMDNMVFGICSQKLREVGVDKSQLISIIEYWDTSSSEYPPENYTPESYQAVLDAYAVALAVRDNEEATQQEVDDAYFGLLNAISGLEEVPIEPEDCAYPLDITPELITLLGYEAFNVHDKCGHILSSSGKGSHAAISQAAAEALISEGLIPEDHILPPSYLGEGVYAVEYLLEVTNIEDKDGRFRMAVGGYRPLTPEHGGGNFNVSFVSENSVVAMEAGAISHDQQDVGRSFIDRTTIRLGAYFNTTDKQVGFIIDGEDVGYLGEYTHDEPFILMAAKQAWPVPEDNLGADVSIKVFTKGKDLTFTYPEGTMGLDGEPVPTPTTIHYYPLDATTEQLQELGAERFILNDDAGHHLSLSNVTNRDFYAVSSAVADAYINGTPIPLEQSIVSVGEIVAVEFMVELVADISSESDLVMLSVGALGEQSGASLACWIQYLSGEPSYDVLINTVHGDGGENLPLTGVAEWGGDISFRIGLCFDFSAHEVHCIIDGENFGSYEIGEDSAIPLEVSAVCWEGAVIHSADIRTFINGKDLQFSYPLGTVGLDGEPVIFQQ